MHGPHTTYKAIDPHAHITWPIVFILWETQQLTHSYYTQKKLERYNY
jgi:hypothetical protein